MSKLLPSQGVCHACYVLAYVAGLDNAPSFVEWVDRARRLPAGLTASHDLESVAAALVERGIVKLLDQRVRFVAAFPRCRDGSHRLTRLRIARLLLEYDRPEWLSGSGDPGQVAAALIPAEARAALAWLGDELQVFLADLLTQRPRNEVRQALGDIGEEFVLENEKAQGRTAARVSLVSDSYGYDVESEGSGGSKRRCIEVKCTLDSQAGGLYLTRNEYETCLRHPDEWLLVQVTLHAARFWAGTALSAASVRRTRSVVPDVIAEFVVPDTSYCEWCESVYLTLPDTVWQCYQPVVGETWSMDNPLPTLKNA